MTKKQPTTNIFGSVPGEVRPTKNKQFFKKMLFHWPLYIVFFIICICAGIFYNRYVRPVYEIHAKILIKDYSDRGQKAALQEVDLESPETEKDVVAEIGLMGSVPVTEQVVTDLQLWVTYQEPTQYYSYKDIYATTPVQFKLIKPGRAFAGDYLDITIKSADYFLLKSQDDTTTEKLMFKNNYSSSFGTWKLDTTGHLKRYIGKTIRLTLNNPKDITKYYQDNIAESIIPKSSDVDIVLKDEVPERGRAVINDLIRVYMDASVEEKRQSTQNTLKFVNERLVSITQELNNVESNYQGFKSNRGITDIANISSVAVGNQQSNQKQVNDIDIKLSVIDNIERYVNSNAGADNPPATLGMDDPGLLSLIKQLTDLQLERTKLLATLPETNPLFNPINQQISATRVSLKENLKGIRESLISQRSQLKSVGSTYISSIRGVPEAERGLNDIKRNQVIKENLYTYLLQKKEELSLDYASTISDARIIDHAHNGQQKWPIPKAVYALGLLLGFLIPTGILQARIMLKTRIANKNEIASSTGMSVLSEIIYDESSEPIVVSQNNLIGEQFRDLRTKLNYLHAIQDRGKVTLFTSSIASEGKSFVLRNLGAVLSFAGKKTILIELDLRRPTFAERFKLNKSAQGLTDFLIGNATESQVIQSLPFSENLFVITSGMIPPNPSELLESAELSKLIKDLTKRYDHVLIDSPPVHLLTDAMILAPMCDVSLYMVRQDFTPKQELEFISELYREQKLPRMNLIFNAIKTTEFTSGYNYQKNSYIKKTPTKFKTRVKRFFSRF